MALVATPALVRTRPRARTQDLGLVALALAVAGLYLHRGVGFVLDDFFFLRNARFDGILHTAGSTGGDRPVGALVYMLLFGAVGAHPAPIVLLLALGNGIAAVLLRRLLCWWWTPTVALVAAGLWVLLPLRTSLEVWMSTGSAVAATAMTLGALVLVAPPRISPARLLAASALLALGALTYEALVILGLPAAVAMRLLRDRRVEVRCLAGLSVAPLLAFAWAYTHRLPGRHAPGGLGNPFLALEANFGRGIAPDGIAVLVLAAAVAGTAVALRAAARRPAGARWTPPVSLLVVGWAIVAWGVVPYLTYYYSPFGAGDRLNVLSAFGTVLVWAGLLCSLPRRGSVLAGAALVAVALVARVERTDLWSRAGLDGPRVAAAIVEAHPDPDPDRVVLVGPAVVRRGVSTWVDRSNIEAALQLAYDRRDVRAAIARTGEELDEADPSEVLPFDQRPVGSLDDADP